jgi:hypothetical protein
MMKSKKANVHINMEAIVGAILGLALGLVIALTLFATLIPTIELSVEGIYNATSSGAKSFYAPNGILTFIIELLPFVIAIGLSVAGFTLGSKKKK